MLLRCRPSFRNSRKSCSPNSFGQIEIFVLVTPGCLFYQVAFARLLSYITGTDFAWRDYFSFFFWKKKVATRQTRRATHVRVRRLKTVRCLASAMTGIMTTMALRLTDVNQISVLLRFVFFEISVRLHSHPMMDAFFSGGPPSLARSRPTRFGLTLKILAFWFDTRENASGKNKQKRKTADQKLQGAKRPTEQRRKWK